MFTLQGMNQPLIAEGWKEIFPHGQVLHGLLPKDFSQGWRDPLSNRMQLLLLLGLSRYLNSDPKVHSSAHPEPPQPSGSFWARGGQPCPPAQPLPKSLGSLVPMSPGPKLLISSFFFTSHLSFRSLFCQPFPSLLFQLPFFLPQTQTPSSSPHHPLGLSMERWPLGARRWSIHLLLPRPTSDAQAWTKLQDAREIFPFLMWSHFSEETYIPEEEEEEDPPADLHLRGSGSQALLRTAELINALELTCDSRRQREILKASQSIKFIPTCTMWSKPHLGFLSCAWQS